MILTGPVTHITQAADLHECRQCGIELHKRPGPGRWPVLCDSEECRDVDRRVTRSNTDADRAARAKYSREWYAKRRAEGMPVKISSNSGPCAGGCGRIAQFGGKSLPLGQRKCQKCRNAERVRECRGCGTEFRSVSGSVYCNKACYLTAVTVDSEEKRAKKLVHVHRRRDRLNEVPRERYTTAEIAERDDFRCGICDGMVDMSLSGVTDDWGPTVDHVMAVVRGGDDTKVNVQLAHRICNLRKGT